MRDWSERWSRLGDALVGGIDRFPIAFAALIVAAAIPNLELAGWIHLGEDDQMRLVMAFGGAATIATAAALFCEAHGLPRLAHYVLPLIFACLVATGLWFWSDFAVAMPALIGAIVLAIPLAPYLGHRRRGFWTFLESLVLAAIFAAIAINLLCLGVTAILLTLEYLFGAKVPENTYPHVWWTGALFLQPFFALALIPPGFPDRDEPDRAQVIIGAIRIVSDFIVVPLLAIYAAILLVYAVDIAIVGELPKGAIGWMVLTFGLAVLATRLIVHPLADLTRPPTRLFLRYWALALVGPLALFVVAVWERIEAYGVTPERYGLVLFALFLALVLLAELVPRTRGDVRLIPAIAGVLLLLASFGPWSAIPVSARSQMERLKHYLAEAGALSGETLVATPRLTRNAAIDVRSIVSMLREIGQIDRLVPLFTGRADSLLAESAMLRNDVGPIFAALNVTQLPPAPGEEGAFSIRGARGAADIGDFDLVVPNIDLGSNLIDVPFDGQTLTIRRSDDAIEIAGPRSTLSIAPEILRDAFRERIDVVERLEPTERPPFFIDVTRDGKRIGLLFESVTGRLTASHLTLNTGNFSLYLRRADWAD